MLKDAESAKSGVHYLASQGSRAVKVWFIVSPQLPVETSTPGVMAAGEEARKNKLPLIVHATGLVEAKASLRAGANVLVHSVEDVPVDQEFLDLARKNGTIVIPTLTGFALGRSFPVASLEAPACLDWGDVLITEDGRLALLDLGMVGRVAPDVQEHLLQLLLELAHAQLIRELFPDAPLKYMPPTKHMTGNVFAGYLLDAFFNLAGVMTDQSILLIGMMTEGIHTPFLSDRDLALENVRYVRRAAGRLGDSFRPEPDGFVAQRARGHVVIDFHVVAVLVCHALRLSQIPGLVKCPRK